MEESFTAGLLHDIGKVIFLSEMLAEYRHILGTSPGSISELEMERLGCTHAQVGAYLMSIWGLPVPLVHAVAFHHYPSKTEETKFSSLIAVHAADAIASAKDPAILNQDIELDLNFLDRLGLRQREAVWRGFHQDYMVAIAEGASDKRKGAVGP